MPLARCIPVFLSLLVMDTASAQYRTTRLSAEGQALTEARPSEVKACVRVYQWDRCSQPDPVPGALVQPDPERRTKCIISSRNVAAKKGATHFTVRGALFQAYRCPQKAPSKTRDGSTGGQGELERLRQLGFKDWSQACGRIEELFPKMCALKGAIQSQVTCRERRARALMEGERIYRLDKLRARVERIAPQGGLRVHMLGVLGQRGARSDQQYISAVPLMMARRGSATGRRNSI